MAVGRQLGVRPRKVAKKSEVLNNSKLYCVDGVSLLLGRRLEPLAWHSRLFVIWGQNDCSPTDSGFLHLYFKIWTCGTACLSADARNFIDFKIFILLPVENFSPSFETHFKMPLPLGSLAQCLPDETCLFLISTLC